MVRLYLDENVHGGVARGLRRRGIDVTTAQEDGRDNTTDPLVLARATELGRVLVSHDDDLVKEALRLMEAGEAFAGVIFVALRRLTVGELVHELEVVGQAGQPEDFADRVTYLPL